MGDKVKEFINKTLKEESDIWLAIAKEKSRQYPNEGPRQIIIRTIIEHFEHKYPSVMAEFDVIDAVEQVGDYFSEGLTKLNKIYTIEEILAAVKVTVEKLK